MIGMSCKQQQNSCADRHAHSTAPPHHLTIPALTHSTPNSTCVTGVQPINSHHHHHLIIIIIIVVVIVGVIVVLS